MSRPLVFVFLTFALLGGCADFQPLPPSVDRKENEIASTLAKWLALHTEVQNLSSEQAVEKLITVGLPQGEEPLYYYGLLNQQLDSYGGWIQARDAFIELEDTDSLSAGQRQLAGVLRVFNQNRINAQLEINELLEQNTSLTQQLANTEEEKQLLEQKIQALTDLESVISTRKEE